MCADRRRPGVDAMWLSLLVAMWLALLVTASESPAQLDPDHTVEYAQYF